jgi:hypothetical protein
MSVSIVCSYGVSSGAVARAELGEKNEQNVAQRSAIWLTTTGATVVGAADGHASSEAHAVVDATGGSEVAGAERRRRFLGGERPSFLRSASSFCRRRDWISALERARPPGPPPLLGIAAWVGCDHVSTAVSLGCDMACSTQLTYRSSTRSGTACSSILSQGADPYVSIMQT